jgi:hypothetical protein
MPKESTYCVADPERQYRVDIGWSRDRDHVEIGTLTNTAVGIHNLAQHVPDSETPGSRYEGPIAWNGLHCQLDRRAINDLIRSLRKARDQAFGRDE